MVVDSSAVLAVLFKEAGSAAIAEALFAAGTPVMSAATLLECALVAENRLGEAGAAELDALLVRCGIDIVDVTPWQIAVAREGFRRFGKGRHPAALNFGDCFSYALAKTRNEALLYKGDDFSLTDLSSRDQESAG